MTTTGCLDWASSLPTVASRACCGSSALHGGNLALLSHLSSTVLMSSSGNSGGLVPFPLPSSTTVKSAKKKAKRHKKSGVWVQWRSSANRDHFLRRIQRRLGWRDVELDRNRLYFRPHVQHDAKAEHFLKDAAGDVADRLGLERPIWKRRSGGTVWTKPLATVHMQLCDKLITITDRCNSRAGHLHLGASTRYAAASAILLVALQCSS